jgi:basic amino acid/polyamine antiporter, APA family
MTYGDHNSDPQVSVPRSVSGMASGAPATAAGSALAGQPPGLPATTSLELSRQIGFWGGSAIMVGIIIGSGIFRTPASIAGQLGSPSLILVLWAVGGVLSLFGALSYAELGTMFPRSGGIYAYIHEGLGKIPAFVFGWTYMILVKPLAAAAIAMVCSEHLNLLFGLTWDPRIMTCVILLLLTAVNTVGVGVGANLAILLTGFKFLALAAIVAVGLILMQGNTEHLAAMPAPKPFLLALAPALAAILWTYDGWSDVASVAGEVREPQRLLPRIFVVGTAATALLYLAVNAIYIWMLGLEEMRTTVTVAPLVMERLLGTAGAIGVTLLILISTLGATHCSIITGARVTFAQARDGLLFRFMARVHPVYRTPDASLWVQGLLSCTAVIVLQRFENLIGGFVFMMWIFYALAAVALIILRIRRPDLPRPYRCWGYPVVPVVFILSSAFMTVLTIRESPLHTLPWLGLLAAGLPAYWFWQRFAGGVRLPEHTPAVGKPPPNDQNS